MGSAAHRRSHLPLSFPHSSEPQRVSQACAPLRCRLACARTHEDAGSIGTRCLLRPVCGTSSQHAPPVSDSRSDYRKLVPRYSVAWLGPARTRTVLLAATGVRHPTFRGLYSRLEKGRSDDL